MSETGTIGASIDYLDIQLEALEEAQRVYRDLGPSGNGRGLDRVGKRIDWAGQRATRMDLAINDAMLEVIERRASPVEVWTEESGQHRFAKSGEPINRLFVVDSLDGTARFLQDPENGLFGPMTGAFEVAEVDEKGLPDPIYNDGVSGAMKVLSTGEVIYATKNGPTISELPAGRSTLKTELHTSGATELNADTTLYSMEELFETFEVPPRDIRDIKRTLRMMGPSRPRMRDKASLVHYKRVAEGERDLAVECTRQMNLEPGAARLMIVRSGGVVFTKDDTGNVVDLGEKRFKTYGQKTSDSNNGRLVVVAASEPLARAVLTPVPRTRRVA